jgi:hypothetical protein
MKKLLVVLDLAKKARENEIRGDRIFSNGNCANFQFCKFDGCKECNRKERKFTNEELRGLGL